MGVGTRGRDSWLLSKRETNQATGATSWVLDRKQIKFDEQIKRGEGRRVGEKTTARSTLTCCAIVQLVLLRVVRSKSSTCWTETQPITRSAEILSRVKQALHDPKITDSLTDCCPDADRV